MRKPVVLITGANGEIGHGLVEHFAAHEGPDLVALDLKPLDEPIADRCSATIVGDILDEDLLQRLVSEYEIHQIFHLAALLSTRSEYTPVQAHRVNVNGTLNLLQLAHEQARWHGHTVKFLFPSSIAVFGLPSREIKDSAGPLAERDHVFPRTMYGCNKLYCERLGRYFTSYFRQLAAEPTPSGVDFRSLRFPGLISAETVPSGGTSDYGPEMIHAGASGEAYPCFVDEEAELPFMAMPDAVRALVDLAAAPKESLTRGVYNITAFSVTARHIYDRVMRAFPDAKITFEPDVARAKIVDSWPGKIDDGKARRDWGWKPEFDEDRAFDEYVLPRVKARYAGG